MRYWLLSLPRVDMETCIKVGTFGLNRKYILGKVQEGDKVACYITKEYKIIATGTVTRPYYMNDTRIFSKKDLFPDRIDFEASRLSPELDFMSIIDRMSFINNLAYWSVYLRSAITEMSAEDWKLIQKKANQEG